MSIPEVWKFIKDYGFSEYINQDEHKTLVRLVNMEGLRNKQEN